jgi:MurNAc alpha-1-phosphate uridylyltransferase
MTNMPLKEKPDHAFILAAGKGTRLRPYTDNLPKPMVPVNGRPILDYTLEKLEIDGVKNVTINLNYLGDRIINYYDDFQRLKITYSEEMTLLDTGGGVKNALHTMNNQPFYMINGDALWTDGTRQTTLQRLADQWNPSIMDILILLQPVENMILTKGVGDYDINEQGQAVRSKDKTGKYMFGGIRIARPEIFENSPEGAFSFLILMDEAEKAGRLHGLIHDGEWHHISTPTDLEKVNDVMAQAKAI